MFIVACFSSEMRNTTATSEEAITLAKSSRRDRSVMKETMPAVTATANQNRAAIGSVQSNKMDIVPRSTSALVTAITCRVPALGMANASCSPLFYVRRRCHLTVIMRNGEQLPLDEALCARRNRKGGVRGTAQILNAEVRQHG